MQNTALNNCRQTHKAGLQRTASGKNVGHGEGIPALAMPRYTQNTEAKAGRISAIAEALTANLDGLRYGQVSVTLRVHDGRVVDITQSVTQNTKGQSMNKPTSLYRFQKSETVKGKYILTERHGKPAIRQV